MSIYNGKLTAGVPYPSITPANMSTSLYGAGGAGGTTAASTAFVGGAGHAGGAGQYIMSNGTSAQWSTGTTNQRMSPLVINGKDNKEIVRLDNDGTVTWADTVKIDEAVKAFGQVLTISVENSAGLTYAVKQRMRDTVFEEMISMAKEKGSLTADDLTYLHQAAKIMDKLKGKE